MNLCDIGQVAQQQSPDWLLWLVNLVPFLFLFLVFYFLAIRPQQKQAKLKQKMLENLQKGDVVLTSAGFYGKVDKIRDDEITLLIDESNDGIRMKLVKNAIVSVVNNKPQDKEKK